MVPLNFISVEHTRLQKKYGKERGTRVGEVLSMISGWGLFLFWFGVWITPQPRYVIPVFQNLSFIVPIATLSISVLNIALFVPFFVAGAWLGIQGVKETTLKVAEIHRTDRIITTGVYSLVRHPQYLGGILAHIGFSILLSAWYSLIVTPIVTLIIYLISKKEEEELLREFGREYEEYRKKVPMFIPL